MQKTHPRCVGFSGSAVLGSQVLLCWVLRFYCTYKQWCSSEGLCRRLTPAVLGSQVLLCWVLRFYCTYKQWCSSKGLCRRLTPAVLGSQVLLCWVLRFCCVGFSGSTVRISSGAAVKALLIRTVEPENPTQQNLGTQHSGGESTAQLLIRTVEPENPTQQNLRTQHSRTWEPNTAGVKFIHNSGRDANFTKMIQSCLF